MVHDDAKAPPDSRFIQAQELQAVPIETDEFYKLVMIARVCYEALRIYDHLMSRDLSNTVEWLGAEQYQVDECIAGARQVLVTPGITVREFHSRWMADKHRDGWTLGPQHDPIRKANPFLVKFEELPERHLTKYKLFIAIVNALG
jgi:hypothetical protein